MAQLIFLISAAFMGATISGFLGMAGGATLLGLMLLTNLQPSVVVPIHAVVQLASNSTRMLVHLKHVRWSVTIVFMLAAIPGPFVGIRLLNEMDPYTIRGLMGVAILYAAWVPKWGLARLPDRVAFAIGGVLGGTLGVLVGAVGPLIAPFFLRDGFDRHSIIATKAVCQAYLHVLKLIAFASIGFSITEHLSLTLPMICAVILGTYAGRWILQRLSEKRFVTFYRVVLSVLAARLLWQAVTMAQAG